MKKISILIFLLVVFLANIVAQETDEEKKVLFDSQKKDPTVAMLLPLVFPTLGHLYAGKWARGLPFQAGKLACLGLILAWGTKKVTEPYLYGTYQTTKITTVGYVSIACLVGLVVWEMIDAKKTANEYNSRLYRNIFKKNPKLIANLFYMDKNTGKVYPAISLNYNF